MIGQSSRKITGIGFRRLGKKLLCALLLLLWVFSFLNTSSASQTHNIGRHSELLKDCTNPCDAKIKASDHHPFQSHFPELQAEGFNESDEKELEDQVDEGGKATLNAFGMHQSVLETAASTGTILPNPHRRLVALFILFHSWKSHLS